MELRFEADAALRRAVPPVRGRNGATPAAPRTGAATPTGFLDGGRCPELDCVERLLPSATIAAARKRAAAVGVGADRVLVATGHLSEEAYLKALGESLGVAFEPLDNVPRVRCPADDDSLADGVSTGMLQLIDGDDLAVVVAPRERAVRRLITMLQSNPALARRFRFTTTERLNRFVMCHAGRVIAARATNRLQQTFPMLSAGPRRMSPIPSRFALAGIAMLAGAVIAPTIALHVLAVTLATLFLAWLGLRFAAAFIPAPPPPETAMSDGALPVYSVVSALYREADSVDGLLNAFERLDYPPEKLDVIVALEADDLETRAAIVARRSRIPISVVVVPPGGPRTKPRALNVALALARGTFTVIYDAEDRPEPNQLRRALQAFVSRGKKLACVQARLCIDNTADSWLARLFTAEYAGQFDAFLPGLAIGHLPLPLGGSSNHFRTATLRAVGAWDPYNVTEDADLGMRLARFGYRAAMIESTTYEEAPAQLGPWLRQRTRWFKGWMQTWLVHMREPRRLLRDLGWPGFLCFQLIVGGNALAALVHPLFLFGLATVTLTGVPLWTDDTLTGMVLPSIYVSTATLGYLVSAGLGLLGLSRRGLTASAWVLLLTPMHWLLLSVAAWRALYQLIVAPYVWEKTTHGLAKHSRLNEEMTRSVIELEQCLRDFKRRRRSTMAPLKTRAVRQRA
jgi:cellulose synthase/poly-beta-1,6-N-acetylglucosamine synthase-like glycosyltransferase